MAYTTIDKPSDYFNTVLYTGDGNNSRAVTGTGFQADWVWLKDRGTKGGSTNYHHQTWDSVRGASDGTLYTSLTNAVDTNYPLTSFDSNGITLRPTSHNSQNETGEQYVLWNWKAGGTASSNTDGSITSSVSANQDAGFSIVSYTGTGANATVGHGLSSVPYMMIIKKRNSATGSNWMVYHKSISGTGDGHLWLDLTNGRSDDVNSWNNTAPTSSVFSIGTRSENNGSGDTFIAYCFAPKSGFSSMGQYTGNGNADGTFTYLGFKPAFVMVKPTTTADNWVMFDNKRLGYNPDNNFSYANKNFAENDADIIDLLSNGFKQRSSGGTSNRSGDTFIYMAFAENPFTTSSGVPACAR